MTRRTFIIAAALVAVSASRTRSPSKTRASRLRRRRLPAGGGCRRRQPDPRLVFLAAQSQQKLRRPDDARHAYERLAARPAADPWSAIGRSAIALLAGDAAGGVQQADQAVAGGPSIAEAHLQRGLALSAAQNMGDAAAAFQKASDLDPTCRRALLRRDRLLEGSNAPTSPRRTSRRSLKLAPQAPERGEVAVDPCGR